MKVASDSSLGLHKVTISNEVIVRGTCMGAVLQTAQNTC